ncbi:FliH/SctL family protein [Thalassolituus alkanivorans]|uniref:FliH/SctL family protein n=1 Tax=Thalassolituus alkanivorans TaxID=2881055 RepID=UPI001E5E64AF|nr:FliH/SctL family protein [Thalassolituus alkanivorans]MCB2385285.1 hypothetical protein [Thalassolituus alkanivorans]MCB2421858.1 hypothetical protein [Thalassolituus alkanivorans]
MTELHQKHHLPPIPAKEAREVKPWRLPFWTEPPAWLVEKEAAEKAAAEQSSDEGDDIADVSLPTAEELENIRRDAYNAGLEQGLIEGRQQGQREGYDAGHAEGYKAAFDQGHTEGREEGFGAGEADGKRKGQADINAVVGRLERVVKQLQSGLIERDQQLPEVLAALVAGICERVIGTQLADGAVNIHRFVQHALAELPSGEEEVKVFVGPDDARHLQASLEVSGQELHYSVDDKLPAGNCRIESEHSLVEYSSAEYLNQLLDSVLPQLMHQAASFPDEDEQAGWQEPESVVSAAVMDIDSPADSAAEFVPAESDNEAPAPDSLPIDKGETDNVWPEGDGHEPE